MDTVHGKEVLRKSIFVCYDITSDVLHYLLLLLLENTHKHKQGFGGGAEGEGERETFYYCIKIFIYLCVKERGCTSRRSRQKERSRLPTDAGLDPRTPEIMT